MSESTSNSNTFATTTSSVEFADACEACASAIEALSAPCIQSTCDVPDANPSDAAETVPLDPLGTEDGDGLVAPVALYPEEQIPVDRTAAFPTGIMEALESHDQEDAVAAKGLRRFLSTRRGKLLVGMVAAVAVLAIAVGAFFASGGFGLFSTVNEELVEETLRSDADFMDGYASNEYVNPSEYELSNVRILSESDEGDGVKRVQVSATLANDSFSSDCNLSMEYVQVKNIEGASDFREVAVPQDAAATDWVGRIVSEDAATKAISGVDYDPSVPEGFDPTFNEEAQSCSFEDSEMVSLWFADVTNTTEYAYSFNGEVWERKEPEERLGVVYLDELEGSYTAAGGDAGEFTTFSVSDLDVAAGTFTLTYEKSAGFLSNDAISGSLSCTLTRMTVSSAYDDYRQEDGAVYLFEGTGTSSGGDGEARISGALTAEGGLVFKFQGDYTDRSFFGGEQPATTSKSGAFTK